MSVPTASSPQVPASPAATALELLLRAEKAERELVSVRATLAQHVDENLDLHRRVAELEATMTVAREAREALIKLERERNDAEARADELAALCRRHGLFDTIEAEPL